VDWKSPDSVILMRPGTIPTVLLSPSVNVHCRPKASREIKPRCLCPITRQVPPPPPHVRKFPGWTLRRQKLSLPLSLPPSPSLPPSLAPFLPRSLFPPSSVRPSLPPSVPVPALSVCLPVYVSLQEQRTTTAHVRLVPRRHTAFHQSQCPVVNGQWSATTAHD